MTALIRGEMVKVRTTRTAFGFGLACIALVLLTVLVTLLAGDPTSAVEKQRVLSVGGVLSIPLLLFGIVGATAEFRHRTLAASLLISPNRGKLTFARMIAYGITSVLVGIAMLVVAFAIGLPLLSGSAGPSLELSNYWEIAWGGLLCLLLMTMLGVGVGTLVRNQVVAIVGALLWLFILEELVVLISEEAYDYTLKNVAFSLGGGGDLHPMGTAALTLATWAAVFVVAGVIVDARRDVQ